MHRRGPSTIRSKLEYPRDFVEIVGFDEAIYLVEREGTKVTAICRDCEQRKSILEADFTELQHG
jgi:hypothetical protein